MFLLLLFFSSWSPLIIKFFCDNKVFNKLFLSLSKFKLIFFSFSSSIKLFIFISIILYSSILILLPKLIFSILSIFFIFPKFSQFFGFSLFCLGKLNIFICFDKLSKLFSNSSNLDFIILFSSVNLFISIFLFFIFNSLSFIIFNKYSFFIFNLFISSFFSFISFLNSFILLFNI